MNRRRARGLPLLGALLLLGASPAASSPGAVTSASPRAAGSPAASSPGAVSSASPRAAGSPAASSPTPRASVPASPPSASPGSAAATLEAPSSVRPGETLIVLVSSPLPLAAGGLEARRTEGGYRMSAHGLPVSVDRPKGAPAGRDNGLLFLLPLPLELPAGSLSLSLSWTEGGRSAERLLKADIAKRAWNSEDIQLDEELTVLQSSPDPRKAQETDRLSAILLARSPGESLLDGGVAPSIKERYRTSFFGDRRRYLYASGKLSSVSVHSGIDLREDSGFPVKASASGVVALAANRELTGNTVVLRHADGLFSLYYHLRSLAVKEADRVSKGQVIGELGATGLATGPHLHWEFRLYGEAVDPDALVSARVLDKIHPASTIQAP